MMKRLGRISAGRTNQISAVSPSEWTRIARLGLALLVILHFVLLALMLTRQLDGLFNDADHRIGPATDFTAYYVAGVRGLDGLGVYGHGPGFGYRYHPLFALSLGGLFKRLGLNGSFALWITINEAMLALLLVMAYRRLPPGICLPASAVLLCFTPYLLEIYMGNASFVAGALALLAIDAYRRGRVPVGAALLTVSIIVKPLAVVFLPLLIIRRHFASVGVVLISVTVSAAPYFWHNPDAWRQFVAVNFRAIPAPGWVIHAGNQGLHALLVRLAAAFNNIAPSVLASYDQFSHSWQAALIIMPLGLCALSALATWTLRQRWGACIALWSVTYLLGYKDVWEHSYAFMLPALLALWSDQPGVERRLVWLAAVGLALPTLLVLYHPDLPPGPYDPEPVWDLPISLLHHATKPLFAIVLYIALLRLAWRQWRMPDLGGR